MPPQTPSQNQNIIQKHNQSYHLPAAFYHISSDSPQRTGQNLALGISIICLLLAVALAFRSTHSQNDDALQLALKNQAEMNATIGEMNKTIHALQNQKPQTVVVDRGPVIFGFPILTLFPFILPTATASAPLTENRAPGTQNIMQPGIQRSPLPPQLPTTAANSTSGTPFPVHTLSHDALMERTAHNYEQILANGSR